MFFEFCRLRIFDCPWSPCHNSFHLFHSLTSVSGFAWRVYGTVDPVCDFLDPHVPWAEATRLTLNLVADTKMPNTHKSDPECYNLRICFAKASTSVPKLTWIIEESFLWLKFHSFHPNMRLDLASSSFSFVGPATNTRLRIWSYPRDAGVGVREWLFGWHFRSMSFDSSMHGLICIYSWELCTFTN